MKNNTLKTEKIMATSSIKKAIRYTISFHNWVIPQDCHPETRPK